MEGNPDQVADKRLYGHDYNIGMAGFYFIKMPVGHREFRYEWLVKNLAQVPRLFSLANLVLVERCQVHDDEISVS